MTKRSFFPRETLLSTGLRNDAKPLLLVPTRHTTLIPTPPGFYAIGMDGGRPGLQEGFASRISIRRLDSN